MSVYRALSALFFIGIVGCVTSEPERVEWGAVQPRDDSASGDPTQEKPVLDDAFWDRTALAEYSAQACSLRATDLDSRGDQRGWQLYKACIRRDDFLDFLSLTESRWSSRVVDNESVYPSLVDLIVRRSADDPAADLKALRVHVLAFEDAFDRAEAKTGSLVLVRARVVELAGDKAKSAKMRETRLEAVGRSYGSGRWSRFYRNRKGAAAKDTGRVFVAHLQEETVLEPSHEYLVLGRLAAHSGSLFNDPQEAVKVAVHVVHAALLGASTEPAGITSVDP